MSPVERATKLEFIEKQIRLAKATRVVFHDSSDQDSLHPADRVRLIVQDASPEYLEAERDRLMLGQLDMTRPTTSIFAIMLTGAVISLVTLGFVIAYLMP